MPSAAALSLAPVRTVFVTTWLVILSGLVIWFVVGITHN
jgi:hypothetical protein